MSTSTSSPNPLPAPVATPRAVPAWTTRPLQRALARLLAKLRCGSVTVQLPSGERIEGRGELAGPHTAIVLHRWRAIARLLLQGDLGLAESYRDGDWSTPDLSALLELGVRNEAHWAHSLAPRWPMRWVSRLAHRAHANSRRGSRRNIAYHYDMGNDFYAQWLDADLNYSSGLYSLGDETLEQAQAAKLACIAELLALEPGAKVLEIGCGWGALALALGQAGARLTGLTLSTEQLAYAQWRVAQAGLQEHIELRLQDYRDVDGQYDCIVAVEMLEAVGEHYWPQYFDKLRQCLKPGGRAVLQVITVADDAFEHYRRNPDFIQRHIFPGGMLPSVSAMQAQARQAGLQLVPALSFGPSYAKTLAEWRSRFLRAWSTIEPLGYGPDFKRLWEYYLCYCEAGFRARRVDVGLFTLTRPAA